VVVQTDTTPQPSISVLAGIVAIGFGLIAILWPHITLALLVVIFGAFAVGYGVVSLVEMVNRMRRAETWWTSLIIGIVSIIAGLYVLTNVAVSTIILAWVIAVWALFVGIIEIVAAIATRQFLLLILGVVSVVFSFILLSHPTTGALALVFVIGIYAVVRGILVLLLAFRSSRSSATPA
jgi:uncharacterized membrane protein HdeD (DUF308 family)